MTDDPYTMEVRLCDDDGIVSHERVEPGSPGTIFDSDLTYYKLHNNLRAHNMNPDTRKPYDGEPFACTGHAHLAGQHIRCTSPAHRVRERSSVSGVFVVCERCNWSPQFCRCHANDPIVVPCTCGNENVVMASGHFDGCPIKRVLSIVERRTAGTNG